MLRRYRVFVVLRPSTKDQNQIWKQSGESVCVRDFWVERALQPAQLVEVSFTDEEISITASQRWKPCSPCCCLLCELPPFGYSHTLLNHYILLPFLESVRIPRYENQRSV